MNQGVSRVACADERYPDMLGQEHVSQTDRASLAATLRSDHQTLIAAVDRLLSQSCEFDFDSLFQTTLAGIEVHLTFEEATVYPLLRRLLPNGESEVIRLMAHAALIEQRIATLRSLDLSNRQRARLLGDLRSLIGRHVDRQEARQIPVIADAIA